MQLYPFSKFKMIRATKILQIEDFGCRFLTVRDTSLSANLLSVALYFRNIFATIWHFQFSVQYIRNALAYTVQSYTLQLETIILRPIISLSQFSPNGIKAKFRQTSFHSVLFDRRII